VVTGTAQPYLGPAKRDGGSTGALVLGILSLLCAGIFGMAFGVGAIVTGLLSRRRIRASGGMLSGEGTATTGLVLGILGLIVSTIAFVYLTFVNPDALSELLDQLETTTTTTTPR
jgi:hypothetical protein